MNLSRKFWLYSVDLKDGLPIIWVSAFVAWFLLILLITCFGDFNDMNNLVLNIFFSILIIAIILSAVVFLEIMCLLFFVFKSDKTKFVFYSVAFGCLIYLINCYTQGFSPADKIILNIALTTSIYSVARGAWKFFMKE